MNTICSIPLIFITGARHPANNTFAMCCVAILVLFVIVLIIRSFLQKAWNKGEIPANFKATKENVFEIYIAAACAVILRDPKNSKGKFAFINQKLRILFPNEYYQFSESYHASLQTPLKIDGLCKWANANLSKSQKIDILNFLAELIISDDYIHENERKHLYAVINKMHLNSADLDTQLTDQIFAQNEPPKAKRAYSNSENYLRILGLTNGANQVQIKQAYRTLVKIIHPDRFMNESLEVQEEMKRKFQEIQEAYEKLTETN